MKNLFIIIISILCVVASGQSKKRVSAPPAQIGADNLPRRVVDTIATDDPETQIILYSNNTWQYHQPGIKSRIDNSDAYKYNWQTESIFAYRNVELADLPEVIELKLFDSLAQFHIPIHGRVISKYGLRRRAHHNGTDIPLITGEPLYAVFDGKVRYAQWNPGGYGYLTIIRHPNGLESWYAHQSRLNARVGDFVKAGQVIGFGGNTGRSRGAHLHFELRYKDQSFDPELLLDFEEAQVRYQNFALEKRYFNIRSRASEILEEDDFEADLPASMLAAADNETIERVKQPAAPAAAATSTAGAVYHTIKSGDTLGHISSKYGVSIDKLCQLNNITRTTVLALNRKIRVK